MYINNMGGILRDTRSKIAKILSVPESEIIFKSKNRKAYCDYKDNNDLVTISPENEKSFPSDFGYGQTEIYRNDRLIGYGSIYQMPGCCGVAISTGCSVLSPYSQKGIGKILNKMRQDLANYLGYSMMICTDKTSNSCNMKVLEKTGWKKIHERHNRRSGNSVGLFVVNLG